MDAVLQKPRISIRRLLWNFFNFVGYTVSGAVDNAASKLEFVIGQTSYFADIKGDGTGMSDPMKCNII